MQQTYGKEGIKLYIGNFYYKKMKVPILCWIQDIFFIFVRGRPKTYNTAYPCI